MNGKPSGGAGILYLTVKEQLRVESFMECILKKIQGRGYIPGRYLFRTYFKQEFCGVVFHGYSVFSARESSGFSGEESFCST